MRGHAGRHVTWTERRMRAECGTVGEQVALLIDAYLALGDEDRAHLLDFSCYMADKRPCLAEPSVLRFEKGGAR